MYAYRNKNTGDVVVYGERHPELEALDNWVAADDADITPAARAAYETALSEQRMIEEAQVHRFDRTAAANRGNTNELNAQSGSLGTPPPTPVAAHYAVEGVGDKARILDKANTGAAAVQIGPDPDKHPQTPEECAALGAWQTEHPPTTGVLARAKADHKSGATQTGYGDTAIHAVARSQAAGEPVEGYDDSRLFAADRAAAGDEDRHDGDMPPGATTTPPAPADSDVHDDGDGGPPATGEDDKPTRSARKPELVAYAVEHGGMTEDDARALTRDELAERFAR